ncbi:MAG: MmgE/PrpD family protein [Rhodospirillales bacterium]|nr:MmgE/PrpD family protein [Rhodospirillales bacterium]
MPDTNYSSCWLFPLAQWGAGLDGDALAEPVRSRLGDCALDWWGAMIAGTRHRLAEPYRRVLGGPVAGDCSVAGCPEGRPPLQAAAANAALSHLLEVDDGHRLAMMHPGVTVFPVVMALAEHMDLSAAEMRAAVVVGYEVGLRVGALLGKAHYATCHTTATAGCFGAAAAAARILGLDAERTLWALGHAGTQAAGLWQFLDDGAEAAKAFHPATAVRNGLTAAMLASEGIPGAARVLEGRRGLLAAWGLAGDPAVLADGLGDRFEILQTTLKGWPACGQMHSSLDALRDLMRRERLRSDDIERIVVTGPRAQVDIADVRDPRSFEEAKFSTRFCIAFLALEGSLSFSNFTPDALDRDAVRRLSERVEVVEEPSFTARFPAKRPARVEVLCRDGSAFSAERSFRRGDPEDPWSWADLVERFDAITVGLESVLRGEFVAWSEAFGTAAGPQGGAVRALFRRLIEDGEIRDEA